jgi:hypothetical protein
MVTIEAYEKTPSGAHKITLLGGHVAGTFDDEIGAVAERLAAEGDEGNPVAIRLEKRDDKVFITHMKEILPPEELGGEPDSDAPGDAPTQAAADEGAREVAVSPAPDSSGEFDLRNVSDEELLNELAYRLESRIPMEQC